VIPLLFFYLGCSVTTAHPESFVCPACDATYVRAGTCHGFGPDKHDPRKVVAR
jgi:hypothetical protein